MERKPHLSFEAYVFKKYFTEISVAIYKKFDKRPIIASQRFSDKFHTAGTDKMTKARQTPGRGWGWAPMELTEP